MKQIKQDGGQDNKGDYGFYTAPRDLNRWVHHFLLETDIIGGHASNPVAGPSENPPPPAPSVYLHFSEKTALRV